MAIQNMDLWGDLEADATVGVHEQLDVLLVVRVEGADAKAAVHDSAEQLKQRHEGFDEVELVGVIQEILFKASFEGLNLLQDLLSMIPCEIVGTVKYSPGNVDGWTLQPSVKVGMAGLVGVKNCRLFQGLDKLGDDAGENLKMKMEYIFV